MLYRNPFGDRANPGQLLLLVCALAAARSALRLDPVRYARVSGQLSRSKSPAKFPHAHLQIRGLCESGPDYQYTNTETKMKRTDIP